MSAKAPTPPPAGAVKPPPPPAPPRPRQVSCGCCTGGCVCWNHRDEPRLPQQVCGYHKTTPHTRATEAQEGQ